jgi:hypothetical protein
MTDAELIELSLRARLAQLQSKDIRAMFSRGRTLHIDQFMITSNRDNIVFAGINGEPFFWHSSRRDPLSDLSDPEPPSQIKDIVCKDRVLAKELLSRLRTAQVLDDLARIE